MKNEERKPLTEEEMQRMAKLRALAERFETEGEALAKDSDLDGVLDRLFRSQDLRTQLLWKDPEHEKWDDFRRVTMKYIDELIRRKDYQNADYKNGVFFSGLLRTFPDKESDGFREAFAVYAEKSGEIHRLLRDAKGAAMRYGLAADNYALLGRTDKADECRRLQAEISAKKN